MHGAIGLGHLSICSHSFRIGKQLNCWCFTQYIIRIRIFIIPINGIAYIDYCHWRQLYIYNVYKKKNIYIYIYKYIVSCRVQSLKKKKKKKKKKI